jgi:hypothetical protein
VDHAVFPKGLLDNGQLPRHASLVETDAQRWQLIVRP